MYRCTWVTPKDMKWTEKRKNGTSNTRAEQYNKTLKATRNINKALKWC